MDNSLITAGAAISDHLATPAIPATPAGSYRARRDRFAAARDACARRGLRLSHVRFATFFLAIALGVWAERSPAPLPFTLAALALLGFLLLIVLHRRARRGREWFQELVALNEQGLRRLARDWDALPVRRPTRDLTGHPYARDLDLYGRASIAQLLGPVSGVGADIVDDWLLARAEPATVRARQEAVRELAPMLELREELAVHGGRAAGASTEDVARFLHWAEGGEGAGRPVVRWAARLLPLLTLVPAVLQLMGRIEGSFWLLGSFGAILLTLAAGRRAQTGFRQAAPGEVLITHYPGLLAVVERATFRAPLLRQLQHRIVAGGQPASDPASRELARLAQLLHLADLRRSGMLYLPVQLLTLWDFHVQDALDRWRRRSGAAVRGWTRAAGELEALASLAALAHDHPDWAFAEFTGDVDAVLQGDAIGHPLLPESARVDNDVRVGPPGTFLLVTGSNMSGKSTLLRAIGTNAVLAQAGAPCCARSFTLPPLELWSCIRIEDSLAHGVSYFMAELQRLKQIVDAATRPEGTGGATAEARGARLLFLIDEVLNGTNTAERQIAARRVIRHLVAAGALGVVTTHDLDLAQGAELAGRAEPFHFKEILRQEADGRLEMTFDYRLRPGLATSTNALALLEFVGLPGR
jgi:hypothetical protein